MDSEQSPPFVAIIVVVIGFIIPGIIWLTMTLSKRARLKRNCTMLVPAKCIMIDQDINGSRYPIYEVTYNNRKYTLERGYTGFIRIKTGEMLNLYINPENPKEFYDPADKVMLYFPIFMSLGFILSGIMVIYFVITG